MPNNWQLKTLLWVAAIVTLLAVIVIAIDDSPDQCGAIEPHVCQDAS